MRQLGLLNDLDTNYLLLSICVLDDDVLIQKKYNMAPYIIFSSNIRPFVTY